jgi:uncharacterized protein YgiB involved in biofilm formation
MGNMKFGGPRKRSNKVVLVAMGMSVSAFALTGCEEKVDAFQFSTVDGCITSSEFTEAECQSRFATAQVEHVRAAPRYSSRADCEVEHGVEACAPREPAQPGQQVNTGGGGLWMPLMMGWMMGRTLGGPVATQPLYRSSKAGMARTASGATVDAKSGSSSVGKRAASRPAAGKLMARGGFGRTGGSVGSRSFGG